RMRQRSVVVYIRPEEAILIRKLLVDSSGVIIFADDLLAWKHVASKITRRGGARQIEKRQILRDLIIDASGRLSGRQVFHRLPGGGGARAHEHWIWNVGAARRRLAGSKVSCVRVCRSWRVAARVVDDP